MATTAWALSTLGGTGWCHGHPLEHGLSHHFHQASDALGIPRSLLGSRLHIFRMRGLSSSWALLTKNCCLCSERVLEFIRIQPQAIKQAQFESKINFMCRKDLYLLLARKMLLKDLRKIAFFAVWQRPTGSFAFFGQQQHLPCPRQILEEKDVCKVTILSILLPCDLQPSHGPASLCSLVPAGTICPWWSHHRGCSHPSSELSTTGKGSARTSAVTGSLWFVPQNRL